MQPRLRRPTGTVQDTLVEVGSDRRSWALPPAEQVAGAGATRVRVLPLDPPLALPGTLVAPDRTPDDWVAAFVAAFGDDGVPRHRTDGATNAGHGSGRGDRPRADR